MATETYAQKLVRERTGRDPQELVRELYVDKRHTQAQIAKAIGVERSTLAAWFKEWGISRDDRSGVALPEVTA